MLALSQQDGGSNVGGDSAADCTGSGETALLVHAHLL